MAKAEGVWKEFESVTLKFWRVLFDSQLTWAHHVRNMEKDARE